MLLLIDIDGTLLLNASRAHAAALHQALREVHGIAIPPAGVDAAGRTDQAIARDLLLLAGVEKARIDDHVADVRDAACAAYAGMDEDLTGRVAPGASAALEQLADVGHELALLTGNLEPIARMKLRRAGLDRFFAGGVGAFGSDHEDRTALVAIARRRAGGHPAADTVVVGDTPRDIACARVGGARVIAVSSGPVAASELTDADVVVGGFADVPAALERLGAT